MVVLALCRVSPISQGFSLAGASPTTNTLHWRFVLPLPRCHTVIPYGRQHGVGWGHHSMKRHGKEDIQPPGFIKPQRTGININTQIHAFPSLSWLVTPRAFQNCTSQLLTAGGHLEKEDRYASVKSELRDQLPKAVRIRKPILCLGKLRHG